MRRHEADAWERLCALYGPVVYGWCRRLGQQDSDASDSVQEVFRAVSASIGTFRGADEATPDGGGAASFRGWLWTIARNQVRLQLRKQAGRPQAIGGSDAHRKLAERAEAAAAHDDETTEPDGSSTRRRLVQGALDQIRQDFSPTTWQAFTRVSLQGESIAAVASDLGLSEAAVRQAKFRVLRRLGEELEGQL